MDQRNILTQNRNGFLNILTLNEKDNYVLDILSTYDTKKETFTKFSYYGSKVILPMLEYTGISIMEIDHENQAKLKEIQEFNFKNENLELNLDKVGLVIAISEDLIENRFSLLGYETASNYKTYL